MNALHTAPQSGNFENSARQTGEALLRSFNTQRNKKLFPAPFSLRQRHENGSLPGPNAATVTATDGAVEFELGIASDSPPGAWITVFILRAEKNHNQPEQIDYSIVSMPTQTGVKGVFKNHDGETDYTAITQTARALNTYFQSYMRPTTASFPPLYQTSSATENARAAAQLLTDCLKETTRMPLLVQPSQTHNCYEIGIQPDVSRWRRLLDKDSSLPWHPLLKIAASKSTNESGRAPGIHYQIMDAAGFALDSFEHRLTPPDSITEEAHAHALTQRIEQAAHELHSHCSVGVARFNAQPTSANNRGIA